MSARTSEPLPVEIREAVTYTAQHWPRTLTAETLLRELDALARRVYVLASTVAVEAEGGPAPSWQPVFGSEVLCAVCARVFCPHGEPLHFHHDGCPACCDPAPPGARGPQTRADEEAKGLPHRQMGQACLLADGSSAAHAQPRREAGVGSAVFAWHASLLPITGVLLFVSLAMMMWDEVNEAP